MLRFRDITSRPKLINLHYSKFSEMTYFVWSKMSRLTQSEEAQQMLRNRDTRAAAGRKTPHFFHTPLVFLIRGHWITRSGSASACRWPRHWPTVFYHVPISTFCCTVWSQSTSSTDRQTDRRTDVMLYARSICATYANINVNSNQRQNLLIGRLLRKWFKLSAEDYDVLHKLFPAQLIAGETL